MPFIELTELFHYNFCYSWWLDLVYLKNQTVEYIKESYITWVVINFASIKFLPKKKKKTLFLSLYTLFFLCLTLSLYFPPYKFYPICKSTQIKTSQFLTSKVPIQVQRFTVSPKLFIFILQFINLFIIENFLIIFF